MSLFNRCLVGAFARTTPRALAYLLAFTLAIAGCGLASDEAIDAATVEATGEFAEIKAALSEFATEHSDFPEELDELELDPETVTSSDDRFRYRYSSSADYTGGPVCRYELSLTTSGENFTTITALVDNRSICDPLDKRRVRDITKEAVAEARQEIPSIEDALLTYYDQNGFFPISLDALELDAEATTISQSYGRYGYLVKDHRTNYAFNGEIKDEDLDPKQACRFNLRIDVPTSVGMTPTASADNCDYS